MNALTNRAAEVIPPKSERPADFCFPLLGTCCGHGKETRPCSRRTRDHVDRVEVSRKWETAEMERGTLPAPALPASGTACIKLLITQLQTVSCARTK